MKIKWKLKINLLKDIFRLIPKLNFLIEIKKKLTRRILNTKKWLLYGSTKKESRIILWCNIKILRNDSLALLKDKIVKVSQV